jgi:hypothetical protein
MIFFAKNLPINTHFAILSLMPCLDDHIEMLCIPSEEAIGGVADSGRTCSELVPMYESWFQYTSTLVDKGFCPHDESGSMTGNGWGGRTTDSAL